MRGTKAKRLRKLAGHGPKAYVKVGRTVRCIGARAEYQRLKARPGKG